MSEYQYTPEQREVVDEQKDLQNRIYAINDKLNKGQTPDMSDDEWNLLNLQAFSMRGYNFVILARIEKYNREIRALALLGEDGVRDLTEYLNLGSEPDKTIVNSDAENN